MVDQIDFENLSKIAYKMFRILEGRVGHTRNCTWERGILDEGDYCNCNKHQVAPALQEYKDWHGPFID